MSCSGGKVILQTVPAVFCGFNGCSKVVQCFLDPGSQTSFVRVGSVQEFGLDGKSVGIAYSMERDIVSKHLLRQLFAVQLRLWLFIQQNCFIFKA